MNLIVELVFAFVMLGQPQQAVLGSDCQVFQRDEHDQAWVVVPIPGDVSAGTTITLEIEDPSQKTTATQTLVCPGGGLGGVRLGPLTTGGPYSIARRIDGFAPMRYNNLYVGDLWILAGQSNMQGFPPPEGDGPQPLGVHSMRFCGFDWQRARQPLHALSTHDAGEFYMHFKPWLPERFISLFDTPGADGFPGGVSCGMYFADALKQATDVPIGLIPCAVGGTILSEWAPGNAARGEPSLYAIMMRKVRAAGGRVRGMLWYQGESDAADILQDDYGERFEQFVRAVRSDLTDPQLPILPVQLGRFVTEIERVDARWSILRQDQHDCATRLEGVEMVSMVESTLWDPIHIDIPSQERLGRQLAWLAEPWVNPALPVRHGVMLERVYFMDESRSWVAVEFSNVTGRLMATGVPTGFSILNAVNRQSCDRIISTRFDPDVPNRVVLHCKALDPELHQLGYAYGANTYVNIRDSKGMSIPGFGPVAIEPPATDGDGLE